MTKDDLDKAKNTNAVDLAGLTAMGLGEGDPYPAWKQDDKGNVIVDKDGKPTADPFILSYKPADAVSGAGTAKDPTTFNFHTSAASVVSPHGFGSVLIQACVAILLLVGFESVTAMGEEAKNPKKGHWARGVAVAGDPRGDLLPVRVFRRQLFPKQRLHDLQCGRFRRAHRGHDDAGGHVRPLAAPRRARRSC